LPADFDDSILTRYQPNATSWDTGTGTGCIAGTDGMAIGKCYRNCAYNQCVSIYACLSWCFSSFLTSLLRSKSLEYSIGLWFVPNRR
jgi:hypothetical protein